MLAEKVAVLAYLELSEDIDARETVVAAGSLASAVLGAVFWVSRIGFPNPAWPVLQVVGLAMFAIATPLWLMHAARVQRIGLGQWWTSHPALMLFCLGVMALVGMVAAATGAPLAPVLAVPGASLALWTLLNWLRRGRVLPTVAFLLGTMLFTIWSAGVVWGSRYKMPLFWETFAERGNVHHDPLYLTSMANMLETYGVASTGIDGIPLIRYHYGSAWLFGKWAHLIGTDVLSFYSLGYPVIVIPVFSAAIVLLAIEIRTALPPESERPLRTDYRVWFFFLAATVGLIPTDALDALAIWNANVLISESYLIAVPVFLLVVAAGIAFWRSDAYTGLAPLVKRGVEHSPGPSAGGSALTFMLAFLPLALVCLGFLKLSLMLLLLTAILFIAFRMKLWNRWPSSIAAGVFVLVGLLVYRVVAVAAQNGGLSPFNFMRYEVTDGWQQFFPLINLLWTWAYIAGRFWEERISTTRELKLALASRHILDVELVFLIAVLGFLPGEIISIHGGSAVYFSDVQRWVSLAFILAKVGAWARKWRTMRDARAARITSSGWRSIRLSTLLALFVAAPFVVTLGLNVFHWPVRVIRGNIDLRMEIASRGGGGPIDDPRPLGRGLRRARYYPLVTALRDIHRLSLAERRKSALFIPQSYRDYWGMFDSDGRCTFVPFVAPALSGVAMIDGMPAAGCVVTQQYNMTSYTPRRRPQVAADTTPQALCARAAASGLSAVLVLAPDVNGVPRRSRIRCGS